MLNIMQGKGLQNIADGDKKKIQTGEIYRN